MSDKKTLHKQGDTHKSPDDPEIQEIYSQIGSMQIEIDQLEKTINKTSDNTKRPPQK